MRRLDATAVRAAILQWPGLYETEAGERYQAMPVSQVPSQLRDCGWKNVPRFDKSDFRRMGLKIVTARYIGGARPKRFCDVVVARPANPQNSIELRSGSEGPAHDPYHFEEVTFTGRNGKTTYHCGLAMWLEHNGVRIESEVHEAWRRLTGFDSVERAVNIYRMLPWRNHAARCPERKRFKCESGYPGESFIVCEACGEIIESHFNRSAIE
jgi:hypothetical protein